MSTSFSFVRLSASLLFIAGVASGAEGIAGSLARLPQQPAAYEVANRTLTFEDGGVVHLSAAKDDGIAWLVHAAIQLQRYGCAQKGLLTAIHVPAG